MIFSGRRHLHDSLFTKNSKETPDVKGGQLYPIFILYLSELTLVYIIRF